MILVSRRERKRSERGKKKRFPQPDSSAVSITSHYLPSGGGGGGGGRSGRRILVVSQQKFT